MTLQLAPGPTSLDRLETSISRMTQNTVLNALTATRRVSGRLDRSVADRRSQRNLEVLDACVILPEALKPLGEQISRRVAGPEASAELMKQFGVARAPAVVFLRHGQFVGILNGIRDWGEYQSEVSRLMTGPANPNRLAFLFALSTTKELAHEPVHDAAFPDFRGHHGPRLAR